MSGSEPEVYRYLVPLLALTPLAILIFGLHDRGKVSAPNFYGIQECSGFTGGFLVMLRAPVIMLYLGLT